MRDEIATCSAPHGRVRRPRRGTRWARAAVAAVLTPLTAHAAPPPPPVQPKALPAPPTIPLVRLEIARRHVIVIEDVVLRRGVWSSGDLDLFVAFGAPGVPEAFDATLQAASDDGVADGTAVVDKVTVVRALRRPPGSRELLGPPSMAGAVLHLRGAMLTRAFERSGAARLRVRTLLVAPPADSHEGHEVLVRLGSHLGEPDALGTLEIASREPGLGITAARAELCGPDADRYPLAVTGYERSYAPADTPRSPAPTAPVLSVRHATDDLCIRYWTSTTSPPLHRARILNPEAAGGVVEVTEAERHHRGGMVSDDVLTNAELGAPLLTDVA